MYVNKKMLKELNPWIITWRTEFNLTVPPVMCYVLMYAINSLIFHFLACVHQCISLPLHSNLWISSA
jgi:hypothetical protein